MNRTKGTARLGFAAALLALLIAPLAIGLQSANAQGPDAAQYYGSGLSAGDTVGASVNDVECGSVDADADGNWILQVAAGDACAPEDGDTVNFSLNGDTAEQTEAWSGGGTPSDPAGISLTVAAMPEATEEAMPEATEEAMPEATEEAMPEATEEAMPETPEEPETGNAGLVSSESGAPLMALALGILMVGGIAGARASTRRVS